MLFPRTSKWGIFLIMYAIISFHDEKYQPLADYTWVNNKIPYAERHGYHVEYEDVVDVRPHAGQMQKTNFIWRMLTDDRPFEWIWWTGCDLMITNWNIKIEDRVDNNYHLIITTDFNGFNADSILIRKSDLGRAFWKKIVDVVPTLHWHWEGEQKAIKDAYLYWHEIIKVVPQRQMNAYDYSTFSHPYPQNDFLGTYGGWCENDWVIQWPGIAFEKRMELAEKYSHLVVK